MTTDYNSLRQEIDSVSEKVAELESKVKKNDVDTTTSIEDMLVAIKTIAYNQTVLESKFEDILKNQMNTDVLVNTISSRLDRIAKIIPTAGNNGTRSSTSSTSTYTNSNSSGVQTRASSSRRVSTSNSATVTNNQAPAVPVKRGPGRPRKDGTYGGVSKTASSANSSASNSNTSNLTALKKTPNEAELPLGGRTRLPNNVPQVSKSKRYFVNPTDSPPQKTTATTHNRPGRPPTKTEAKTVAPGENPPVKRKRGRPPKKRPAVAIAAAARKESKSELGSQIKTEDKETNGRSISDKSLSSSANESADGIITRFRRKRRYEQDDDNEEEKSSKIKREDEDVDEEEDEVDVEVEDEDVSVIENDDNSTEENEDGESQITDNLYSKEDLDKRIKAFKFGKKGPFWMGSRMTRLERIEFLKNSTRWNSHTEGTRKALAMALELESNADDDNISLSEKMLELVDKYENENDDDYHRNINRDVNVDSDDTTSYENTSDRLVRAAQQVTDNLAARFSKTNASNTEIKEVKKDLPRDDNTNKGIAMNPVHEDASNNTPTHGLPSHSNDEGPKVPIISKDLSQGPNNMAQLTDQNNQPAGVDTINEKKDKSDADANNVISNHLATST